MTIATGAVLFLLSETKKEIDRLAVVDRYINDARNDGLQPDLIVVSERFFDPMKVSHDFKWWSQKWGQRSDKRAVVGRYRGIDVAFMATKDASGKPTRHRDTTLVLHTRKK